MGYFNLLPMISDEDDGETAGHGHYCQRHRARWLGGDHDTPAEQPGPAPRKSCVPTTIMLTSDARTPPRAIRSTGPCPVPPQPPALRSKSFDPLETSNRATITGRGSPQYHRSATARTACPLTARGRRACGRRGSEKAGPCPASKRPRNAHTGNSSGLGPSRDS
jgi:hypothetical protein